MKSLTIRESGRKNLTRSSELKSMERERKRKRKLDTRMFLKMPKQQIMGTIIVTTKIMKVKPLMQKTIYQEIANIIEKIENLKMMILRNRVKIIRKEIETTHR